MSGGGGSCNLSGGRSVTVAQRHWKLALVHVDSYKRG